MSAPHVSLPRASDAYLLKLPDQRVVRRVYVDRREPEAGSLQVGAFTPEAEAGRLRQRLKDEGFFAELHINLVPVHRRLEDWEWDR